MISKDLISSLSLLCCLRPTLSSLPVRVCCSAAISVARSVNNPPEEVGIFHDPPSTVTIYLFQQLPSVSAPENLGFVNIKPVLHSHVTMDNLILNWSICIKQIYQQVKGIFTWLKETIPENLNLLVELLNIPASVYDFEKMREGVWTVYSWIISF